MLFNYLTCKYYEVNLDEIISHLENAPLLKSSWYCKYDFINKWVKLLKSSYNQTISEQSKNLFSGQSPFSEYQSFQKTIHYNSFDMLIHFKMAINF